MKGKDGTESLGGVFGPSIETGSTKEYSVNGNVWDDGDDDDGWSRLRSGAQEPKGREPVSQGGRRGEEWTVG